MYIESFLIRAVDLLVLLGRVHKVGFGRGLFAAEIVFRSKHQKGEERCAAEQPEQIRESENRADGNCRGKAERRKNTKCNAEGLQSRSPIVKFSFIVA